MRCVCLSLLLLLAGCDPGSVEELSRPALVLVVTQGGGFCSDVRAVDADGQAWGARACEGRGALERRERTVSAAERAELDVAFDAVLALPEDADCMATSPSGARYRFARYTAEGVVDVRLCEPGVPAEARSLAVSLEAIAGPPGAVDAGAPDAGG